VRIAFWIIAVAVVVLDQWTKFLVQTHLPLNGPSVPLVPGVLVLTHVHNPGVAFGQLRGAGPVLVIAALLAMGAILVYWTRLLRSGTTTPALLTAGLALPLGGAVGNMIDRVRIGKVVDFFDLGWFPIFNVADSAITIGAAALVLYFGFIQRPEPVRAASEAMAGAPD
jgi:signal peptidase II